ncbi:Alpha-galactosidase A [Frondihabitans sp. 762G35]|uniref:glycoside hydrolase family 27 protein n=1 Tax=Frondihabitans sp. 762G35 TaxID=1446794 RepID=UPI000D226DCB|nr:glycoside hydrolase family 27 protein [Frondihabitans sp. 762G35]ARC58327.1 Alpha-galactosidase A [Frondihabitans sp. 762G35]
MTRARLTTPPRGWNSWDAFGTTVTEEEVLDNARWMHDHLLPADWDTIVVDIQWAEAVTGSHGYRPVSEPTLDHHGRPQPAVNRFPSAADGRGFGPLAGAVHDLGLRFGVHMMRGIPRSAVDAGLPVAGTDVTADRIADRDAFCTWNPDNYGVDLDHPAGQAWYDGLVAMLAGWGVDLIKLDDVLFPYRERDIEAYALAIERSGRDIALSLSPGRQLSLERAEHLGAHADLWRVSDDLWDTWDDLREQFQRAARWAPFAGDGRWPDLDMLPLGRIGIRAERGDDRQSRLTPDEQRSMLTLWAIARSPLFLGGHLPDTRPELLALLADPLLQRLSQEGSGQREIVRDSDFVVWRSRIGSETAVAVFSLAGPQRLTFSRGDLGLPTSDGTAPVTVDVAEHGVELLLFGPGAE